MCLPRAPRGLRFLLPVSLRSVLRLVEVRLALAGVSRSVGARLALAGVMQPGVRPMLLLKQGKLHQRAQFKARLLACLRRAPLA